MSREGDGAFPLHEGGLHIDNVPPRLGPGQARGHPHLVLFLFQLGLIFGNAQIFMKGLVGDDVALLLSLGDLSRHLSHDGGDFAFKVSHAGLSRVLGNDALQRPIRDVNMLIADAVFLKLSWDQVVM